MDKIGKIMKTKILLWKLCRLAVILLSVMVFTPLVIPKSVFVPALFGLPYALWMGMLVYGLYMVLIITGVYLHSHIYRTAENDG